jgi:hypothetical protein
MAKMASKYVSVDGTKIDPFGSRRYGMLGVNVLAVEIFRDRDFAKVKKVFIYANTG